MTIRNPDAYLAKAVCNYRDDCVAGFPDEWAAKGALWQIAVNVFEIAVDPAPWIGQLRAIALEYLKPGQVDSTLNSAASKGRRG
jgi:hypothetical protein